jgi:hypothetical protein
MFIVSNVVKGGWWYTMKDEAISTAVRHSQTVLLLVLLLLLLAVGAVGEVAAHHTCPEALPEPLYERCLSYHG